MFENDYDNYDPNDYFGDEDCPFKDDDVEEYDYQTESDNIKFLVVVK